jgi:hypothetical protein
MVGACKNFHAVILGDLEQSRQLIERMVELLETIIVK